MGRAHRGKLKPHTTHLATHWWILLRAKCLRIPTAATTRIAVNLNRLFVPGTYMGSSGNRGSLEDARRIHAAFAKVQVKSVTCQVQTCRPPRCFRCRVASAASGPGRASNLRPGSSSVCCGFPVPLPELVEGCRNLSGVLSAVWRQRPGGCP